MMAQNQITAKKQQGENPQSLTQDLVTDICKELQLRYTNYKNNLQTLAQKIGDVEQETEEHKYGCP